MADPQKLSYETPVQLGTTNDTTTAYSVSLPSASIWPSLFLLTIGMTVVVVSSIVAVFLMIMRYQEGDRGTLIFGVLGVIAFFAIGRYLLKRCYWLLAWAGAPVLLELDDRLLRVFNPQEWGAEPRVFNRGHVRLVTARRVLGLPIRCRLKIWKKDSSETSIIIAHVNKAVLKAALDQLNLRL